MRQAFRRKKSAAATLLVLGLACAVYASGCDEAVPGLPISTQMDGFTDPSLDGEDGSSPISPCDQAPIGTPCGEAGGREHCIFNACVRNACGDSWPAFGEECDDGNERSGDGCSDHCVRELAPGCSNGVLEPGEGCDDGNTSNDDHCTVACTRAVCGDRIVSRGEACDDGNLANTDACTSRCQNAPSLCGNGEDDGAEACDDANDVAGDGCENDCTITDLCGNGVTDPDEFCDDGNNADGDTCESNCTLPTGAGGTTGGASGTTGGSSGVGSATGGVGGATGGVGGATGGVGGDTGGVGGATGGVGGDTGGTGGMTGGTGGVISESCEMCRASRCSAYVGTDPVAGCIDATAAGDTVRTDYGTPSFTPAQIQACIDGVECAHIHNCGHDLANIATPCFCGPITVDACNLTGPSPLSPCRAEWEAMAGTTTFQDVLLRMGDTTYPSGWSYLLLECEASRCHDNPMFGDCTP